MRIPRPRPLDDEAKMRSPCVKEPPTAPHGERLCSTCGRGIVLIFRLALEVVEVLVALGALPTVVTNFGVGNRATTMRADPIAAV